MSHPKTQQKCEAPLLKITEVISGVVTPKEKAKAMPSPLAKRLNQVTGVISGDVTPKDKTKMSSPLAQGNWGNKWGHYTQRLDKINAKPCCWKKSNKNGTQPYWTGVIGGAVTPKEKVQKLSPLVNRILKRNLLDCLIKQNVRWIVFKYFLRTTYYCSIITMIPSRRNVILNIGNIMATISISWMTNCGNQCKLPLLNYVIVQNNWNRYIGKALNNIDVFSYSPLKIDKSF